MKKVNFWCEPVWNFQVVRFLNTAGRDIFSRKDHIWTTSELAIRMIEALPSSNCQLPKYLQALAEENTVSIRTEDAG